ncbi:hypothetical protein [Flavobacterium suncheonense]|uniref:TonB-dependent receptor plug domain-containing protein n=1 Tax=Flavobacterium suncheonense GH29-5 = DSM 17707 TaxID=1121899 RepID=A0A0A2M8A6_9FLAO|nr:hypothetical protein [Flavobacterium suncheonense]KGO88912.1 hypothetical protein Q764_10905 [Flavobacterium suncheonense GH29-5 = DSM 17707]
MKKLHFIEFILLIYTFTFSYSQAPNFSKSHQEKISQNIVDYFKLDRENIHIHLNKNEYLSSDKIWFKGYITEKKTGLPFGLTINTYVALYNENGIKLKSHLIYTENSTFYGNIELGPEFKTGTYYLQAYTNYMNNFSEDCSSVYKIYIINPLENKVVNNTQNINLDNVNITFSPESGVLLEGATNAVVIKINDCNNTAIATHDGKIVDSKNNTITTFSTNNLGFGKFEIFLNQNETYKAVVTISGKSFEKHLPPLQMEGFTFSVNNYTFPDNTIIKVKTNSRTLSKINNAPFSFVIHQNSAAIIADFTFDGKTEKNISIPNSSIPKGLSTVYLINEKLTKIGERNIYRQPYESTQTSLSIFEKRADSIQIKGNTRLKAGEISISVLPEKAQFENKNQTIYNYMIFDELKEKIPNAAYFINEFNKKKHYELDNILITAQSKYIWNNLLNNPPKENFEFDLGLTLKGKVNLENTDLTKHKINMSSTAYGFTEFTSIDSKNEFQFKNLIVADSTTVHFSLLNSKAVQKTLKMYSSITNNKRVYTKPISPEPQTCFSKFITNDNNDWFPKIINGTLLEDITVNTVKKNKPLTNNLRYNNGMSKGFKITEEDQNQDLLQFIASHGYDVNIQGATVTIISRGVHTFNNISNGPTIYIDDSLISDYNILLGYRLTFVDEIYINKRGYGSGQSGFGGVIRIYTKKGADGPTAFKVKSNSQVLTGGFQKDEIFKNPKYANFNDPGFQNYGTIQWLPKVLTDSDGTFTFSIPNFNQEKVKIILEGIDSDGQILSETKIIEVK